VIVSVPLLAIALLMVRVFGLKSIWRLLKSPNKPLPSYPDYLK
jgi:hypothetical protein